jgi:hypothetical protein
LAITSLVGSPRSASPRARRVISNARPMIRLVSGSNLELPKNCEIGLEISPATMNLLRRFARGAPGGAQGAVAPPGPDGFGPTSVSRPTGMSAGVQVRFNPRRRWTMPLPAAIGAARLTPAANS